MASGSVKCPMRAQPRSQQCPKAFHGVDVHFMKAITVLIPSIFATAVTDTGMRIAPLFQAAINVVLIRVNTGTCNGRFDQWFDRSLLDVFQHPNHHLHRWIIPKIGWLLRGERAASAFPRVVCAGRAALFFHLIGLPLVPSNNVDFITFNLVG